MAERRDTRVTYDFVTRAIARTLGTPGKGYFALLGTAVAPLAVGIVCLLFLLRYGLGLAGYSHPLNSALYNTCFLFLVGLPHPRPPTPPHLFSFPPPLPPTPPPPPPRLPAPPH